MSTSTQARSLPELAGHPLGSKAIRYGEADAILYALAVGAGAGDLNLVYERELQVLPTYGLVLGLWAVEAAGALGTYDPLRSLHAAQRLQVHAGLPAATTLDMTARVAAVRDKGRAAMVDVAVNCPQFTATYSIFLPGRGGWGGDRGPATGPPASLNPSWRSEYRTSPDLAALYRLTGDRHPVHIDPEAAAGYGFPRPILHGLCTLGIAAREVARAVGADPCDLAELQARFAAPVLPGDTLRLSAAVDGPSAPFTAQVGDTAVLSNGFARFGRES